MFCLPTLSFVKHVLGVLSSDLNSLSNSYTFCYYSNRAELATTVIVTMEEIDEHQTYLKNVNELGANGRHT